MFKIKADPEFWFTAELTGAGQTTAQSVDLRVKALTMSEVAAFTSSEPRPAAAEYQAVCERVILDWKGVDTPFSLDALREMTDNHPGVAAQIYSQYFSALAGAKRKN